MSRPQPALWALQRAAALATLVDSDAPLGAAFDAAHHRLVKDYRCEYVFKTAVIHHALRAEPCANAVVGLPIFSSIADVVVAGKVATVSLLRLRGKPRLPYLGFCGILIELANRVFSSS